MSNAMVRGICRVVFGNDWHKCSKATKAARKHIALETLRECPAKLPRPSNCDFGTAVRDAMVAVVNSEACEATYGMASLLYWPHDNSWVAMNCECETCYMEGDVMGYCDPWYLLQESLRNNCQGTLHGTGWDEAMSWDTNPLELHIEASAWDKMGPDGQKRARKLKCPCCNRQVLTIHANAGWPQGN
jgi:hypothetical protein